MDSQEQDYFRGLGYSWRLTPRALIILDPDGAEIAAVRSFRAASEAIMVDIFARKYAPEDAPTNYEALRDFSGALNHLDD